MNNKQKCKQYCTEYLEQLQLKEVFNEKEFERIYRRGGAFANPFSFGLSAADAFIRNFKTN
jgi:hypothetical protein